MKEEFEHQLLLERRKVADGEARNRRLETEQVGIWLYGEYLDSGNLYLGPPKVV